MKAHALILSFKKMPAKARMKNSSNKTVKKGDLPSKICLYCNRSFTWRKKWEKNWTEVKFCSDKCRSKKTNEFR